MGNIMMNIAGGSFTPGDGGGEGNAPDTYTFFQGYSSSSTFTVPETGWYRIFCIGKSGDGAPMGAGGGMAGSGGGGSGGLSASALYLRKDDRIPIIINNEDTSFGEYLYATAGQNGSGQNGGAGGQGYNGNLGNRSGYSGGKGGNETSSANGIAGVAGDNGGMSGGVGGSSKSKNQPAGSGGGGGARLGGDDICPYISPNYSALYRAGKGGNQNSSTGSAVTDASVYPAPNFSPSLKLFGGGGGGGGYRTNLSYGGAASAGTPGVVVIEKGVQ